MKQSPKTLSLREKNHSVIARLPMQSEGEAISEKVNKR